MKWLTALPGGQRGFALAFAISVLLSFLICGCLPLPDYSSGTPDVYLRRDEKNVPTEAVVVVHSSSGWVAPLTPEGPHVVGGYKYHTGYYFSTRHIRRKPLHFLDADPPGQWELFALVQGTNCWVGLQGWAYNYNVETNRLLISVFTPHRMLYQQNVLTTGLPETNSVHFLNGNRTVSYQSTNDQFTYDVLANELEKQPRK